MSQETVEKLKEGQELSKEEVNRLKTQMNLIIQIILRKEGDPSSSSPQVYTAPQPWVIPPSQQKPCQQRHNGYLQENQSRPESSHRKRNVHFDPIPIPNGQILPYLIQKGLVDPKPLPPKVPPYPSYFDVNAKCEYHAGSPGHTIENCKGFKYKVQELIDRKLLSFKEEPRS
ncbi:hypothetical protein QL285_057834 [Trifolium repens]|nr:hypothetical protein QL285_057834 [Trifolium repens]